MPNNIHTINDQLAAQAEERAKEAAENFQRDTTLTPEENERLMEIQKRDETVVKEIGPDGKATAIPVSEFVSNLESQVKDIRDAAGNVVAKGLNVGDIKKSLDSVKQESKDKALDAFRKMSVINGEPASDGGNIDDDLIMEINNEAIETVMKLMKVSRLDSNNIPSFFRKMSLHKIAEALPARFIHMYLTPAEIQAENIQAKNRIIQVLVFLAVTGPEMDYLNEYIDQQNKLMMLSNRLIQTQADMSEVLKSKEKISSIIAKANELVPMDTTSVWAKHIHGDPKAVHNLFAQMAVTMNIMKDAYEKLYEEYKDDYDCRKMIQEQIDECDAKYQVYLGVTDLKTFSELLVILETRLKDSNRNGYKNLVREGVAAVDRIRKAKQNVKFPIYSPKVANFNKPESIFNAYMEQYPGMLAQYNKTVRKILADNAGAEDTAGVTPIEIAGVPDETVYQYFSLILLIMMGRVMKALSGDNITKYDAIELDCYFNMYCKAGSDIYLMDKIWKLLEPFIKYSIETWPVPKKSGKKG